MGNVIEATSSEEVESIIKNNENVILDFWGTWCAPCKMMMPIVTEMVENDNITLIKVDIDNSLELAKQHGVRNIPFFKFYKNGELKATSVGSATKSDFTEKVKNAFI